jgi:tetratricopeptide (TPR) repeat protein
MKTIKYLFILLILNSCGLGSDENNAEALKYYEQGKEKLQGENYSGAIIDFNKSIEINPNNSDVYYSRAQAKEAEGDVSGMFSDLDKSIELNPKNIEAYHIRGSKRFMAEKYELAIQDMKKCIELDPKQLDEYHYYYYEILAESQNRLKQFNNALLTYNKLIQLDPLNASGYYNKRAGIKFDLDDFEGALNDYTVSIKSNPTSDAYMNRATIFLMLRMNNEACLDFEKAGELGDSRAYEIMQVHCY